MLSSYWHVIFCVPSSSPRNAQSTPKQGQHCNPTVRDTPISQSLKCKSSCKKHSTCRELCEHKGLKPDVPDRTNLPSSKVWIRAFKSISGTLLTWTALLLYSENKNKVRAHFSCELMSKIIKGWQDAALEESWGTGKSCWAPACLLSFGLRDSSCKYNNSLFYKTRIQC